VRASATELTHHLEERMLSALDLILAEAWNDHIHG